MAFSFGLIKNRRERGMIVDRDVDELIAIVEGAYARIEELEAFIEIVAECGYCPDCAPEARVLREHSSPREVAP